MHKVLAFTVSRASSPTRIRLLQDTITQARKTAGMEFDWFVVGSGCSEEGRTAIDLASATKQVQFTMIHADNVGQHVAWNTAFEYAKASGYYYFLRIDDDCEFITKRWLKKLVDFSVSVGDKFVIAPTVRGLKNPPTRSQVVDVEGVPVEFLREAIGGICRLHPVARISDFVADVRKPLGSGDATGIAAYCKEHTIPFAYVKHTRVRHATKEQEDVDAEHFESHAVFQHIPYIPRIIG